MALAPLHPGQSEILSDLFITRKVVNAVAVCCRGWGKSHLAASAAIAAVNELMQLPDNVPNKNVYIIAPTYSQVTDIYHPLLVYQLGMEQYCIKHSKDDGRIWFPGNVELKLVSYEAVARLRGTGAYFVVNDEVRDWTKGEGLKDAWESIIQPCINTRWSPKRAKFYNAVSQGRSLTISTPKGYDYLYDMAHMCERDGSWKTYKYDYTQAPLLDVETVKRISDTMDPISFAREYLASFEESGNRVFYCFDRKVHVRLDLPPIRLGTSKEQGEDIHIGIDFNVGLQCSSVFCLRGKEIHYLDEFKGHPDTDNLAIGIKARYWPHYNNPGHVDFKKKLCNIYVYPDPTGNSRKTSAAVGTTDLSILAAHGFIVRARASSPGIVDSVASVNRLLKTAAGTITLYIAGKCQGTIMSLERTKWMENNPDTATIDKRNGEEHFSDSVRYPMEYLYPIVRSTPTVKKSKTF